MSGTVITQIRETQKRTTVGLPMVSPTRRSGSPMNKLAVATIKLASRLIKKYSRKESVRVFLVNRDTDDKDNWEIHVPRTAYGQLLRWANDPNNVDLLSALVLNMLKDDSRLIILFSDMANGTSEDIDLGEYITGYIKRQLLSLPEEGEQHNG